MPGYIFLSTVIIANSQSKTWALAESWCGP